MNKLGAMNMLIRSFMPAAARNARIVILGSMPGERSLAASEYYAHPRNTFWKIMQELAYVDAQAAYDRRIRALKAQGIALWDVLHSCHRNGSLDAAIRSDSVEVNDFNSFFRRHPDIDTVLFNGATSERYYKRYVLPKLEKRTINHLRMPSTSPAHASMPLQQKIEAWHRGLARS